MFKDPGVINCFEILEGYFEDFIPIKTFEENVFRIRIYGSITIWEKSALTQAVQLAAGRAAVRMDLSNLESMGTVLYTCFSPLLQVPDVTWQVKEPFVQYLEGVGFSKSQMEILPV